MSDPMPVFTIKAKDLLALCAIARYRTECEVNGLFDQAREVEKAMAEFERWQQRNPDLMKMPDHEHVAVTS